MHKSNLASVLEKIKSFDSKIPKNDGVIAELESKIETLQAQIIDEFKVDFKVNAQNFDQSQSFMRIGSNHS